MIDDDQARRLLRDEAASFDVAPVPGPGVLRDAKASINRRRLTTIASVAAASAALLVGGVVVIGANDDAAPAGKADAPVATPGHRLVGVGRLVVEVPTQWGTGESACINGAPVKGAVVFEGDGRAMKACPYVAFDQFDLRSTLRIASLTAPESQRWVDQAEPAGNLDGVAIERVELTERVIWSGAIVVPSLDAVMWVVSLDRDAVQSILDSAQIVPDDYTSVPGRIPSDAGDYLAEVTAAGLEPVVVEQPLVGREPGEFVSVEPERGTVLAAGSEVTVVVTGDQADAGLWPLQPSNNCRNLYPDGLGERYIAIDATVTALAETSSGEGYTLSLDVHRDFTTQVGAATTMIVPSKMMPSVPERVIGARILVASPAPLTLRYCGYARPYDAETAALWQTLFRGGYQLPPDVTPADQTLVEALTAFARDPGSATLARLPLATGLRLGLAGEVRKTVSNANLADPATWNVPGHWRAHTGPFSALSLVQQAVPKGLSIGAHGQCGPGVALGLPQQTSPELQGLRQISVQAVGATSCLDWWSVDLFVDASGVIQGVTLDLWEP